MIKACLFLCGQLNLGRGFSRSGSIWRGCRVFRRLDTGSTGFVRLSGGGLDSFRRSSCCGNFSLRHFELRRLLLLGIDIDINFRQLGSRGVRISLNKFNQPLNGRCKDCLTIAEFTLYRANKRDALRALLVDGKLMTTQTAANIVGRIERKMQLLLDVSFH